MKSLSVLQWKGKDILCEKHSGSPVLAPNRLFDFSMTLTIANVVRGFSAHGLVV